MDRPAVAGNGVEKIGPAAALTAPTVETALAASALSFQATPAPTAMTITAINAHRPLAEIPPDAA
jgi:hypothetical protein